jgi:septum formation protein
MNIIANQLWIALKPVVLASGSRTRANLLAAAGIDAEIVEPCVDERELEAEIGCVSPLDLALYLAAAKAENVGLTHPDRITIGADQVLEVGGLVLHKAKDSAEAYRHLNLLQGREHFLHSGVAIVSEGKTKVLHQSARMVMRSFEPHAISTYIQLVGSARVMSSVGGYQLEGLGIHLFETIDGDYSTILGLPLVPLLTELRSMGALAL